MDRVPARKRRKRQTGASPQESFVVHDVPQESPQSTAATPPPHDRANANSLNRQDVLAPSDKLRVTQTRDARRSLPTQRSADRHARRDARSIGAPQPCRVGWCARVRRVLSEFAKRRMRESERRGSDRSAWMRAGSVPAAPARTSPPTATRAEMRQGRPCRHGRPRSARESICACPRRLFISQGGVELRVGVRLHVAGLAPGLTLRAPVSFSPLTRLRCLRRVRIIRTPSEGRKGSGALLGPALHKKLRLSTGAHSIPPELRAVRSAPSISRRDTRRRRRGGSRARRRCRSARSARVP